MKLNKIATVVPVILMSIAAQAHDPKEHMQEQAPPDCSLLKTTDPAKTDMKDPVMQAIQKKCAKAMQEKRERAEKEADHHHAEDNDHHAH